MSTNASFPEPENGPPLPDPTAPHSSRTYDYLLGGKDNLDPDRQLMEENLAVLPDARGRVRAHRLFLARALRYLVAEQGIRQILDIGCGLPMPLMENVHEIAQQIAPETRVAYVDSNPVAIAHMRALHADDEQTVAFHGDLLEPDAILGDPQARAALDFSQPVGVLLVSVLQCLAEDTDPADIIARLRTGLAPGSYLVVSHISADLDPRVEDVVRVWARGATSLVSRTRAQLEHILDGFDLVEPGMVPIHEWRPDGIIRTTGDAYGAVVRTREDSAERV